jgi:hypothetical protein
MQRTKFYVAGVLLAALACPLAARGEDKPASSPDSENLPKKVETLENRIRSLQAELDEARAAAVKAQMQADAFENRCRKLQEQLSGGKTTGTLVSLPAQNKTAPANPKPGVAQGKITAVGKDGRLLQISIGADAGIKEGQKLEVFRLGSGIPSRPLYLGTMTLIRIDAQAALGEFRGVTGSDNRPKVGDDAATEFVIK